MGFEQLIAKVRQAEDALEAQEHRVVADLQQFKGRWRALWTPGRIVVAGLAAGFIVGRAEPLRSLGKGGSLMQLLSLLPGLLTGNSAQASAAAEPTATSAAPPVDADADADADAETLARAEATLQAARAAVVESSEP